MMSAYLETEGYMVHRLTVGRKLFNAATLERHHLLLLDLGLPDEDGLAVARQVRARSDIPIVVVTGRKDAETRLAALELGVDDYIIKPFEPRELMLRVRNVLQRINRSRQHSQIVFAGRWRIDAGARVLACERGENGPPLTRAEFDLLLALARAEGRVMTRAQLIDAVSHGDPPESDRAVDVLVSRIRKKIEKNPLCPETVLTVAGYGYRIGRRMQ
jgi:DNA-binding response OmpR family regulator